MGGGREIEWVVKEKGGWVRTRTGERVIKVYVSGKETRKVKQKNWVLKIRAGEKRNRKTGKMRRWGRKICMSRRW